MNAVAPRPVAIGIDAGGSATRWAAVDGEQRLCAEGEARGIGALQWHSAGPRAAAHDVLRAIADAARAAGAAVAVRAGLTGFDDAQRDDVAASLAAAFAVDRRAVDATSDIELVARAHAGAIVVAAGTGSVAAFVDDRGELQRAGGRGAAIDDAGGAHWIACRALAAVWRAEDAAPGAWRGSALARRLFDHVGSAAWPATRAWIHAASRGDVGRLASAVAAAADDGDAAALALLSRAGNELARLARALRGRGGPPNVVAAGRVFALHAAVGDALRAALPDCTVAPPREPAHHAAARAAWTLVGRSSAPAALDARPTVSDR